MVRVVVATPPPPEDADDPGLGFESRSRLEALEAPPTAAAESAEAAEGSPETPPGPFTRLLIRLSRRSSASTGTVFRDVEKN